MTPRAPNSSQGIADFLAPWDWFRALSPELRLLTQQTAVTRSAQAGDYIAREGMPSTHWYGVMQGCLQMYVAGADGSETTLYCMREGEWGGDGSLLKKELRRYDLRALTPARICLIPAQTFEVLRNNSIAFNHFLTDIMNARMGAFVTMLAAARLLTPELRVARGLLMVADAQATGPQELAISQHELALICGLSRQRVNLALGEFRQLGMVGTEPRKGLLIADARALRSYLRSQTEGLDRA
ncbi:Crp/Fnr family transcriptional regulator [Pantoea sp. 18069]|uniref:Crp/Fnr family transcriptional regulator n=1 Tax=Pantoea sp. 18069 TaxID=2681415 RepID=UPI00135C23DF|nr:Crp/Fnr family transcriptional regulator [Pantoea sp. 18069]